MRVRFTGCARMMCQAAFLLLLALGYGIGSVYAKAGQGDYIEFLVPGIMAQTVLFAAMFYGANSASVRDPFGHVWVLLSWTEDLDPAEMERRGKKFLAH